MENTVYLKKNCLMAKVIFDFVVVKLCGWFYKVQASFYGWDNTSREIKQIYRSSV